MNGLRGIATGILIATIILGITFIIGDYGQVTKINQTDDPTEKKITDEDVQAYAKTNNLVIVPKEKYDQLTKIQEKEDTKKDEPSKDEAKPKEEETINVTFEIKSGMSTQEVADYLEDKKMLKNAKELIDYLEKNKLAGSVKASKHTVTNKMSVADIAKEITSY